MKSVLQDIENSGLSRRVFLRNLFLCAGSVAAAQMLTACGRSPAPRLGNATPPVTPFQSKFATMGPLQAADANGIQLPAGFESRLLAEFGQAPLPSVDPSFLWHSDPDGGGTFRTDDGGWIYVSNSEARDGTTFGQTREQAEAASLPFTPSTTQLGAIGDALPNINFPVSAGLVAFRGGVSALRFDANGTLIDAYACERDTTTNCSGGATPWGTWINGEEIQDGYMFECSPLRDGGEAVRLDRFGRKGHEMVTVDPDGKAIYHTEDAGGDDRFYRTIFDDIAWPEGGRPDMTLGKLQVLGIPAGVGAALTGPTAIQWLDAVDNDEAQINNRLPDSTLLEGNEGVWYLNGIVFFTTKGAGDDPAADTTDVLWAIDVAGNTIEAVYQPSDNIPGSFVDDTEPAMEGIDNICMTLDGEMLIVEDGGDMRCIVRLPDGKLIPLCRLPDQGGSGQTEVTGVAIGPTGDRIYLSGQRSNSQGTATAPNAGGVTYEIKMPFTVRVDRPLAQAL